MMHDPRRDNPELFADVPIEQPPEGGAGESTETDLPGDGEGPDLDAETKARLRAKVAGDLRRGEDAELGLPEDEKHQGSV